jgi:tetratricopeptide (TPR) repeat protein
MRRPVALLFEKKADVLAETNRVDEGVATARKSLAIFQEIADANSGDAAARLSVAISHLKLADVLGNPNFVNAGDAVGAMDNYRAALAILESLHSADPQNPRVRRFLGMMHERIGAMLEARRDVAGAVAEYQRSAEIRVPMAAEFPNDMQMVRDGAIAHEKLGAAMIASGDLDAALVNHQRALEMFRSLLAVDPKNVLAQHSVAVSHIRLGDLLGGVDLPNLGRPNEARENYRQAIELLDTINRADPFNAATQRDRVEVQTKLEKLPPDR